MTILDAIAERTRQDLPARKLAIPEAELISLIADLPAPRAFASALRRPAGSPPRVIAEVKKASPSKGLIRADFRPVELAAAMAAGGAAAISVLTEPHWFQGSLDYLVAVKGAVQVPVLRKDFMLDPYQLYEARAHGADAILLIAAALSANLYGDLLGRALELGLGVLTEVHNEAEMEMVLPFAPPLLGINSRDLKTFTVDLGVTARLLGMLPENVVAVAESGIRTAADMDRLVAAGADAFLIGETLMRHADPGEALAALLKACERP